MTNSKSQVSDVKSNEQTYRTFIAIELPLHIRHLIKAHIDQLRSAFPRVRASWSREDNLHLTLKFLGEVPVARTGALFNACREAVKQAGPFELMVKGCGSFPPHGKPKVLWIGIEEAETSESRLHQLHAAIEDSCAAHGFEREERPYHPHLTIARVREAKNTRALADRHKQTDFAAEMFTVSEVVVFRSELSSAGSKHSPLSRHRLG
jgi:RNA 2',3'-cyclic 3'-phosphodiesterase